jgi:ferrous-iron efflux pump FieF
MLQKHIFLIRSVSIASIVVSVILIILKTFAWMKTDSLSVQASLIDSLIDALASILNYVAIREALRPADNEHRFGHSKIEALAAQGQAIFISGTAVWLLFDALHRLRDPQPIQEALFGSGTLLFGLVLTFGLVLFQQYVVKQTKSLAIKADSLHYKTDFLLNIGVMAVLLISQRWHVPLLDTLTAMGFGAYILYTAWKILRDTFDILIDRELPDSDRLAIERLLTQHPEVKGFHDLKTRSAGLTSFIQVHLELDGAMTLQRAHEISETVADHIRQAYPHAQVIIHQDACDDRPPGALFHE